MLRPEDSASLVFFLFTQIALVTVYSKQELANHRTNLDLFPLTMKFTEIHLTVITDHWNLLLQSKRKKHWHERNIKLPVSSFISKLETSQTRHLHRGFVCKVATAFLFFFFFLNSINFAHLTFPLKLKVHLKKRSENVLRQTQDVALKEEKVKQDTVSLKKIHGVELCTCFLTSIQPPVWVWSGCSDKPTDVIFGWQEALVLITSNR